MRITNDWVTDLHEWEADRQGAQAPLVWYGQRPLAGTAEPWASAPMFSQYHDRTLRVSWQKQAENSVAADWQPIAAVGSGVHEAAAWGADGLYATDARAALAALLADTTGGVIRFGPGIHRFTAGTAVPVGDRYLIDVDPDGMLWIDSDTALAIRTAQPINVRWFGAFGNGPTGTSVTTTSGSATVTVANTNVTGTFRVGQGIRLIYAGSSTTDMTRLKAVSVGATITTLTLEAAASVTAAGTAQIQTCDDININHAIQVGFNNSVTTAAPKVLYFPAGGYILQNEIRLNRGYFSLVGDQNYRSLIYHSGYTSPGILVATDDDGATYAHQFIDLRFYCEVANPWAIISTQFTVAITSGGTHQIVEGDYLTGETSNSAMVVDSVGTLTGGSWAAGTAACTLTLRTVIGTFQAENLLHEAVDCATIAGDVTSLSTLIDSEFTRCYFAGREAESQITAIRGLIQTTTLTDCIFEMLQNGIVFNKGSAFVGLTNLLFSEVRNTAIFLAGTSASHDSHVYGINISNVNHSTQYANGSDYPSTVRCELADNVNISNVNIHNHFIRIYTTTRWQWNKSGDEYYLSAKVTPPATPTAPPYLTEPDTLYNNGTKYTTKADAAKIGALASGEWTWGGDGILLAFTSGGTYTPVVNDRVKGATSGAVGYVDSVRVTSGTWAGGNAAGTLYLYSEVGTFTATEALNHVNASDVVQHADFATAGATTALPGYDTIYAYYAGGVAPLTNVIAFATFADYGINLSGCTAVNIQGLNIENAIGDAAGQAGLYVTGCVGIQASGITCRSNVANLSITPGVYATHGIRIASGDNVSVDSFHISGTNREAVSLETSARQVVLSKGSISSSGQGAVATYAGIKFAPGHTTHKGPQILRDVFFSGDAASQYALDYTNVVAGDLVLVEGCSFQTLPVGLMTGGGAGKGIATFTANDTTPSVAAGYPIYYTNNSSTPKTITAIDNGFPGQRVRIIVNDAYTQVDFTQAGLNGNAGILWTPASGDWLDCVYDGAIWYCTVNEGVA